MKRCSVQLLGAPRVQADGVWFDLPPDRRSKLLAYLAYAGDWVERDRLASLFWSDAGDARARHNLRQVLKRTRQLPWLSDLEAERHRLRWRVDTDTAAFREALERRDTDALQSLYRGPLLTGFEYDLGPDFERWLALERQRLHSDWREVVFDCARERSGRERHGEAAHLYEALIEHDGYDEEALQALLSQAHPAGWERRALGVYRTFAERLRRDLGVEPTSTTQQLAASLEGGGRKGAHPVATATAGHAHRHAAATSFIGRRRELDEIVRLLSLPECRLLTIVGMGGVGKTRTALEAARELTTNYPAGVHPIVLEEVVEPDGVVAKIAETLAVPIRGSDPPLRQIASRIGDRAVLLVLDGFEHLVEGAAALTELLGSCPALDLIATSREPLALDSEWLLPLEGFPAPAPGTPHDSALELDAVRLFVERAGRVRPDLPTDAGSIAAIAAICRRVEGSPLAIELAAMGMRFSTPDDLSRQLERSFDVLAATRRDRAERHRSIRATFEHSWRLLSGAEKRALGRLSVFHGGFGSDAAAVVAGAPIAILAALADRSLLRSAGGGRYDCHPLILEYSGEKLAERPEEHAATGERHSRFYLDLVERNPNRNRPDGVPSDALVSELANIRAAWLWEAERHPERLIDIAHTLRFGLQEEGRLLEGVELFEAAIRRLRATDPVPPLALGGVLLQQAWLYQDVGRRRDAIALVLEALTLLRPLGLSEALLEGLGFYGGLLRGSGSYADSKAVLEEAIALIGSRRHPKRAWYLQVLAITERTLGNYRRAETLLDRAHRLHREQGDDLGIANHLRFLAHLKLDAGRPLEAIALLEDLLPSLQESNAYLAGHALRLLGQAHGDLGRHPAARDHLHRALTLARTNHHVSLEAPLLAQLARVDAAEGDDARALARFRESIRIARSNRSLVLVLQSLTYLATAMMERGDRRTAVRWMRSVARHPAAAKVDRDRALALLTEAGADRIEAEVRHGGGDDAGLEAILDEVRALDDLRSDPLRVAPTSTDGGAGAADGSEV